MKKNKLIITAIIGIAVAFIAIIAAMFVTGKFDSLKTNNSGEASTAVSETTTEAATAAIGRPKSQHPETVVASVYSSYSENSVLELSLFEDLGFNTVIFDMTKDNSQAVSPLIEEAKKNSLYCGIKSDISQGSDYVVDFSKNNNIDFIILGGADETVDRAYAEMAGKACSEIKAFDPLILIGLEPIIGSKVSESQKSLIVKRTADFVFLSHEKGKEASFKSTQSVWNEESIPLWLSHDLSDISSYSADKANKIIELASASADMPMCKGLAFSPFGSIANASGKNAQTVKEYIKKRDSYLLDKEFSITNHSKTSFTVEQSSVIFKGTSSPAHELLCNGQKLSVATNGDFSLDCKLIPGENTIKFEHKGKAYTYKVTYKIKLLKFVSPAENITVPGGMLVEVSAVALKNASVTLSLNGKNYKMEISTADGEDSPDSSSEFATFSATVKVPESTEKEQNLGKYKVTANYSSLSETLSGASITVTAKEIVTAPVQTKPAPTSAAASTSVSAKPTDAVQSSVADTDISHSQSTTVSESKKETQEQSSQAPVGNSMEKYFYTENYGLGSAKICEIIDDYVEVYPGNDTKTHSVPDCSPLLKGTVDYVKGSPITLDGDKYYVLASGLKVPTLREERLASGSNGKITHISIKDGYVMPKNSIKVLSCRSNAKNTVIVLEMNRAVAFMAKLTGQTYGSYNGRLVSVSSLNCTGLEFTFSDTVSAEGSFSFMDSVIKSAAFSSDSAESTVTLSMQLANAGKFYGFHYEFDNDGNLVISVKHKPSSSLSGYTIMLDPGHGGVDGGAKCAVSSASYGNEKDINLSIATKVKELLEAEGATVLMTRTSDKWVCYTDRNNAVRNKNPDMFIAIHCDSSSSSASAMGTSAFYYRAYGQPLADAIHSSIVSAYKEKIYKDKSADFKSKISRGASFYAFRVTRVEECPAILIEYGFVSNTSECQILQTASNRDILAEATVLGIKNYISRS